MEEYRKFNFILFLMYNISGKQVVFYYGTKQKENKNLITQRVG